MAAENIKILLTEYNWNGQAETPYEASIFSELNPLVTPANFDLMDYLLDEELPIRWDMEYINEDYNSDRLLPMGAEISLKCSNADFKVAGFFRLHLPTPLIKWKAEILYKFGSSYKKIFEGWITPDGVEYAESGDTGHDTNIVIIRIKDYIVELKEYFSKIPLKGVNDIEWTGATSFEVRTTPFLKLLRDLFPGVRFNMEENIADWSVMETPSFHKYENGNIDFWKSGYNRAYENGDNRYDFLRTICNAMGWVFFSYVDDNEYLTLQIKNRARNSFNSIALSSADMIEYTRSKELNNNNYDAVLILNGTMDGGDLPFTVGGIGIGGAYHPQLKGERTIVISNKYESNYNCNHYDSIASAGSWVRFEWSNSYRLQKYRSEDDERFSLYKISRAGGLGALVFENVFIPQEKILRIDAGTTGSFAMKVNVNTLVCEPFTIGVGAGLDHADMVFSGNYGEMLTKPEIMYDDYIKSSLFKDNYDPLISNMEKFVIKYVHRGIIPNPRYQIRGGTQSVLYGRFWDIASMEVDLINEVTTLELIGHRFTYS